MLFRSDRSRNRVRLLAFNILGFVVSAVAISQSMIEQVLLDRMPGRTFRWDKTVRYRKPGAAAANASSAAAPSAPITPLPGATTFGATST